MLGAQCHLEIVPYSLCHRHAELTWSLTFLSFHSLSGSVSASLLPLLAGLKDASGKTLAESVCQKRKLSTSTLDQSSSGLFEIFIRKKKICSCTKHGPNLPSQEYSDHDVMTIVWIAIDILMTTIIIWQHNNDNDDSNNNNETYQTAAICGY